MRFSRMINVVGVHAEGELNEVITGGVVDVPGKTMFDKMRHLETQADELRRFLLFEPQGLLIDFTADGPVVGPAPDLSRLDAIKLARSPQPSVNLPLRGGP